MRKTCAVPSCLGRVEPVNKLGVCWRCVNGTGWYGDEGIRASFEPLLPEPLPEPEPFTWGPDK